MDIIADLSPDAQPTEPMRQRETLLNHLAVHAQARIVLLTAAGDDLPDPDCSNLVAVLGRGCSHGRHRACPYDVEGRHGDRTGGIAAPGNRLPPGTPEAGMRPAARTAGMDGSETTVWSTLT